jgi:cytochrome b involved in lipid metabolism
MKNKNTYILLLAIAVFIVGAVYIASRKGPQIDQNNSAEQESVLPGSDQSQADNLDTNTAYAMSDVEKHNSRESCWTAIRGGVYDLTDWIAIHPGGQAAILSLCGKDGTASFEDQHGGQPRPESELSSQKIGTLTE